MKKTVRIQEYVDIHAPAEEVFAILTDPEKHLQLGPAWGKADLGQISDDYPQSGSSYQLIPRSEDEPPYHTIVTAVEPPLRIAWRSEQDSQVQSRWLIEKLGDLIRLHYDAEILLEFEESRPESQAEESGDELASFLNQPETLDRQQKIARREAVEWLTAIKRYAELRQTRLRLWLRWLMDRYILRLRSDQRRIILALLAMQTITCLTFIAAVVGIGLASLIFGF